MEFSCASIGITVPTAVLLAKDLVMLLCRCIFVIFLLLILVSSGKSTLSKRDKKDKKNKGGKKEVHVCHKPLYPCTWPKLCACVHFHMTTKFVFAGLLYFVMLWVLPY